LQAKANSVPATGLKALPASQLLLAKLMQAAGVELGHSSSATLAQPAAAAAAAAASQAAGCSNHPAVRAVSPMSTVTAQGQPESGQQQLLQQQREESRSNADIAAAALGLITRLRLALTDKVEGIMQQEFEDMWLEVVCAKPPWTDQDFLYVLHKHWRSVLQVCMCCTGDAVYAEVQ
jgi:hypothetical protein